MWPATARTRSQEWGIEWNASSARSCNSSATKGPDPAATIAAHGPDRVRPVDSILQPMLGSGHRRKGVNHGPCGGHRRSRAALAAGAGPARERALITE